MKLVRGDPKGLIWKDNDEIYCPHCNEEIRAWSMDMGGNHSYYHSCHPRSAKNSVRYIYSGRLNALRRFRDE